MSVKHVGCLTLIKEESGSPKKSKPNKKIFGFKTEQRRVPRKVHNENLVVFIAYFNQT